MGGGHYRHVIHHEREADNGLAMNVMDVLAYDSQEKARQKQEDYEEVYQKIRQALKPDYADMIIAICIDGMAVKDYALKTGAKPNNVTQRLVYAKSLLKESLVKD